MIIDRRKAYREGVIKPRNNTPKVRTYVLNEDNKEVFTGCKSTEEGIKHLKSEYEVLRDDISNYIESKYEHVPAVLLAAIDTSFVKLEKLLGLKMEDIIKHKEDVNAKFVRRETNNNVAFHADYCGKNFMLEQASLSFTITDGVDGEIIYTCHVRPFVIYGRCNNIDVISMISKSVNLGEITASVIKYRQSDSRVVYEYATHVLPFRYNSSGRMKYGMLPFYVTSYDADGVGAYDICINNSDPKVYIDFSHLYDMSHGIMDGGKYRDFKYELCLKATNVYIPSIEDGVKFGYKGVAFFIVGPEWRRNNTFKQPPQYTLLIDNEEMCHLFIIREINKGGGLQ